MGPERLQLPSHRSRLCGCLRARYNRHAEFRRFPMYRTASHKFQHLPPLMQSQLYPHHIDKTGGNAPVPAFHCAKRGPSYSGDKDLVIRCGAGHKHGPTVPSYHSVGQASHLVCRPRNLLATRTHPRWDDPHQVETCQAPQQSQQRCFPKRQTHSDGIHQQLLLASRHAG